MAWTTPGTAVAGNVLTAAQWNSDVRDNSLMGNPVFTTEAVRDAAITSPVEGQRVYLTAPTIPAATGSNTFIPTGIQTIYNGAAWVCVTPVGAFTGNSGTITGSTAYTGTLSGSPGTNVSVTLNTGTTAMIHLGAQHFNDTSSAYCFTTFAVSGATTIAASDSYAVLQALPSLQVVSSGVTVLFPGLTAGANTFTMNYRISAGTGNFSARRMTVVGIA
jgi:hypothetical protein